MRETKMVEWMVRSRNEIVHSVFPINFNGLPDGSFGWKVFEASCKPKVSLNDFEITVRLAPQSSWSLAGFSLILMSMNFLFEIILWQRIELTLGNEFKIDSSWSWSAPSISSWSTSRWSIELIIGCVSACDWSHLWVSGQFSFNEKDLWTAIQWKWNIYSRFNLN